mgnify:CR=1 FL=1
MIKVIETTTEERMGEAEELFHKLIPLLAEGYNFNDCVKKLKGLPKNYTLSCNRGWYRDLTDLCKSHGINPRDFSGKGFKELDWE